MTFRVDDQGGGGADALDAALALVTQGLARLADLELWQLSEAQLRQAAAGLDRAGLLSAAQQVRLLGEVDARGLPGQDGTGSPAGWLRSIVPTMRPAEASGLGKRAERLYRSTLAPDLAPTREGLEAGRVRPCQERVISQTIEQLSPPSVPVDGPHAVDPDQVTAAQQMLVTEAARFPAADLAKLAVAVRHHLDPAADDRLARDEAAQQRQRTLTVATESSGMVFLHGSLTPECGAALRTAIDAWSAPQPAADGTPDPRTGGQRRHDALHHLADTALANGEVPTTHGSPAKIIVRVTADTLSAALDNPDAPDGPGTKRTGLAPAELADGTPLSAPDAGPPRLHRRPRPDPDRRARQPPGRGPHPPPVHPQTTHRPDRTRPPLHLARLHRPRHLDRRPPPDPLARRRTHRPDQRRPPVRTPPPPRPRHRHHRTRHQRPRRLGHHTRPPSRG